MNFLSIVLISVIVVSEFVLLGLRLNVVGECVDEL